MNLEEGKQFFFRFNGHGFHMWHDETQKYEEFNKLNISDDVKENWRQDIIHNLFARAYDQSQVEKYWITIGEIISVIFETKSNEERNCEKLIECIEQTNIPNEKHKVLIMEHMAGRSRDLRDGGIFLVCSRTSLGQKLFEVMNKWSDFNCSHENYRRYCEALDSMQRAYDRFYKS